MARKAENKVLVIGFDFADNWIRIREAVNISRWNPIMAIDLMNEAKARSISPVQIDYWNKSAKKIIATIDSISSQRYYDPNTYWGQGIQPETLELLPQDMDLEDWKAMQKALGEID